MGDLDEEEFRRKVKSIQKSAKEKIEETSVVEIPTPIRDMSTDNLGTMVRERPYVAQLVQLQIMYDMAGMFEDMLDRMTDLEKKFSKTLPRGDLVLREYSVESITPTKIVVKEESTMPWISFEIVNEGPGRLYVSLDEEKFVPRCALEVGESKTIDMKTPIIKEVLLYSSGVSTVRIYATR